MIPSTAVSKKFQVLNWLLVVENFFEGLVVNLPSSGHYLLYPLQTVFVEVGGGYTVFTLSVCFGFSIS